MTRDEMRKAMPFTAAIVDDIREVFGNDAIARIDAAEGSHEVRWQARTRMAFADEENRAPQVSRNRRA